jgi:hypothetical protein
LHFATVLPLQPIAFGIHTCVKHAAVVPFSEQYSEDAHALLAAVFVPPSVHAHTAPDLQ